eukprot:CAMPEP_0198575150 /NCGR_PEP_ID=MMETSP1462-20131121/115747_1 /TAXON_ID=1333877 /ORGANISM="Brandtodinium nutriculum, Strain RCC3387" /LENGTH=246 /DNA_ID=CAMNT_0044306385 /DNA_START=137 /DNA_END=877 /DNA_ORIENTATION=+
MSKEITRLVLLAHGHLGSPFDLLHVAETFAPLGFVVAAPEFADSVSGGVTPSGAAADRGAVVDAVIQRFQADGFETSLFLGHSKGGGTAVRTALQSRWRLGRVCICADDAADYRGQDPLLTIASQGDTTFTSDWAAFFQSIKRQAAGGLYAGAGGAAELAADLNPPRMSALLFTPPDPDVPLPSHVSFIDSRVSAALVRVGRPLFPLARCLGVDVLGLDTFANRPDGDACSAMVLPAIVRWAESRK